jgi:hypothetical protein
VNGWHNIVHLLSGLVGLLVVGSWMGARWYAYALGTVYILITIVGFAYGDGEVIIGLIPINTEDNILHLLIGIAGIAAGAATPAVPPPTMQPAT